MKTKLTALALVLTLLIGLVPAFSIHAAAADTSSDMDALTALGIDTSTAPDGYNSLSTDNPYGRNTIALSPVSELYTVGLTNSVGSVSSYKADDNSALQNGTNYEQHSTTVPGNILQSSLYGNNVWGSSQTVQSILGSGSNFTTGAGTTTSTGNYALITDGTVADDQSPHPTKAYLKDAANATTDLGNSFSFALSSVASGNFDGNKSGLSSQTAMVYTSDYSANGGIYLRFGDATTGAYGGSALTLLGTDKKIGNPDLTYEGKPVENFAENPYQLQNYLQVATGDWNGDGIDEIAVYIPEQGNSRIVVYSLNLTSSDNIATAYQDPSKWGVVWTYYLREGDVVSNMVSFTSGDVNKDGIDDLAATWGYYYGPQQNKGSTAVVMFGAKGTSLFTKSQQFDLTYGTSNIVRASFAFGDMAGSNSDTLILCGQSDADLLANNTQTRYVALYNWNGTSFTSTIQKNFNLFEKDKNGGLVWSVMTRTGASTDVFYSLPYCAANACVLSEGITAGKDLLYFDSLIIEYTDQGLTLKEAWDNQSGMQADTSAPRQYVEYGAVGGDFTGKTGSGALVTMTQTLSSTDTTKSASYTVNGTTSVPDKRWESYYKNWFNKLFGIKSWYLHDYGMKTVATTNTVAVPYEQFIPGQAAMVAVDSFTDGPYYSKRSNTDFSFSLCLANTDNDSSYMNYSGKHTYTYTDPQVLSVLASPPYFADLAGRSDLSGSYTSSSTSYSSTKGSGSGSSVSATIKVGAYVSFEHDIEVWGVKVASVEAEATVTAGFTFETESTSTLEQTVSYSASAGEDMVAFYSIPMEIYQYESYIADGNGGYDKILTTVNIPHEAAVRLLSLDEYEAIAKDYSALPKIADKVLTHTIGDPSSYPSSTSGYNVIAAYDGTPAAVGYTSSENGASITQEIAMTKETDNAYTGTASVEAKAGAGIGDFTVGVVAGAEVGAGGVTISTSGSSFSGEMQNMPVEAQAYGYSMNWRIFAYKYNDGSSSFPVVSYLVSDVHNPPPLPDDFAQNIVKTTSNSIALSWSYDKTVAGFRIYRYYEFPEGSGSYEVSFVPFTAATSYDSATGRYSFAYTDTGLSPYTEYKYQIKTVRADNPKESIYSEPMVCRTKTDRGFPDITVTGLDESGQLPIYPDASSTATVSIANASSYTSLSYQWQKLVNGAWTDLTGKSSSDITISNAGVADQASYRCRVNAIYYDSTAAQNYYITAYSDAFQTVYSKRTPTGTLGAAETTGNGVKGLNAWVELYSANTGHSIAPTGNVTFQVTGTDYAYSETVALESSQNPKTIDGQVKYYGTANLSIPNLPDGVYTVAAYYGGNRIFKDLEVPSPQTVVIGAGSADVLTLSSAADGDSISKFTYGGKVYPTLSEITKQNGSVVIQPVDNVSYTYVRNGQTTERALTAGSMTPDVGSYTMKAYVGADLKATAAFSVTQRPVTIGVTDQSNVPAGGVTSSPPVITHTGMTDAEFTALHLTYTALNSAGNLTTLDNDTLPGKYTVTAITSADTPAALYNNYSVTYQSGAYIIIGATFQLTATAQPYTDASGSRTVGSVLIASPSDVSHKYTSGTLVTLTASPQPGYQVDQWTATFADHTSATQTGGTVFFLTMQAQPVDITVSFKPAEITLSTSAQPSAGGAVTCSDGTFTSGAYVSYGGEYTFTATPKAGYHFKGWRLVSGGITATPAGTAGQNGSNSVDVTVGSASATLYADFARDVYTLTLSGDINAYYMFDSDGVSSTPPVKTFLKSGSSVAGDTEITVQPKTGYRAADGAVFKVGDTATTDSASHTFTITQNTQVSLDTVRESYAVTAEGTNGSVSVSIDGKTASAAELAAVPGGSSLTFTARADRGYLFDGWVVNGVDSPVTDGTLTIPELGGVTDVVAKFKQNDAFLATAAVSARERGSIRYTVTDLYGEVVGSAGQAMPSGGVTVYQGETISFIADVNTGSMLEQWKINGDYVYSTAKTQTVANITGDINVTAYLKAATNYRVGFFSQDPSLGTVGAQLDGSDIATGGLRPGGSRIVFTATPATGYMVDYWTITDGDESVAETAAHLTDTNGVDELSPVIAIDPLKNHETVRAHFKALETKTVTLPSDTTKGTSSVVFATPVLPSDDGTRTGTAAEVRTSGTVRLSFVPADGYRVTAAGVKAALSSLVNPGAVITATESAGAVTAVVANLTQDLTLSDSGAVFAAVYAVTVPSGVTASSSKAAQGDVVTLTVAPPSGQTLSTLTLDYGTLRETVSSSRLTYTFVMPDSPVTVNATFETIPVNPDVPSGGGGGGGGGSVQTTHTDIPVSGSGETRIGVAVTDQLAKLSANQADLAALADAQGTLTLDLSALTGVTSASLTADAFQGAADANALAVKLPAASLLFDHTALNAIGTAKSGDVVFSASLVDPETLSLTNEQMALLGGRKVLDLALSVNGSPLSDFGGGTVQVSLPYELQPGEDPAKVVVWYLADDGTLKPVSGSYDAVKKTVSFSTPHFSRYAVGVLPFTDIGAKNWYYNSVSFVYANGLFSGTRANAFTPNASMTRAMLVSVLWRLDGKPAVESAKTFSDVAQSDWFAAAVKWSAANNIILGYNDGRFGANDPVTREQLAAILLHYAEYKGDPCAAAADLSSYADGSKISSWALRAMKWAVAAGILNGGTDGKLAPSASATRAQVAAMLQRFVERVAE